MAIHIPLTKTDQLKDLNDDEILEGYYDGFRNEPEPHGNRSLSYYHGWRNGSVDGGHRQPDEAMAQLAKDAVDSRYLENLMKDTDK